MKKLYFLLTGLIFLLSCKKFEHKTWTIPNCELCAFADSLNGTYRGFASGLCTAWAYSVPGGTYGDSVTMTVEQVFLNSSQYEDSTMMHFKTTYKYDSTTKIIHDTIEIKYHTGKTENNAYMRYIWNDPKNFYKEANHYTVQPDSITIDISVSNKMSSNLLYLKGRFYKQ